MKFRINVEQRDRRQSLIDEKTFAMNAGISGCVIPEEC